MVSPLETDRAIEWWKSDLTILDLLVDERKSAKWERRTFPTPGILPVLPLLCTHVFLNRVKIIDACERKRLFDASDFAPRGRLWENDPQSSISIVVG